MSHDNTQPTTDPACGAASLPRGESVGRYIVLDRIGAGGMGVVYAAYDPELDRRMALKLLRPEGERDSTLARARSRLIREAQAMAKLSHPNVLPVYDVGEVGEQVFVAIEYIDGETLGDWLGQGPHDVAPVLEHFVAAGRGLAAAHAEGLVHRDFKPHNVLLGRRGEVRVMDFGLARPAGDSQAVSFDPDQPIPESDLTATGMVMGTPAYMAPEQQQTTAVDHRADQYSFCVALYEALYGTRPFAGSTAKEILTAVTAGQPAAPVFDRGVPSWLRKAVIRGLAVDPDDRWPDMNALLHALQRERAFRRTATLFGAGALAAAGVVTVVLSAEQAPKPRCQDAGAPIEDAWSDTTRTQLEAAFTGSDRPYAHTAWDGVENALSAYATQWAAQRVEACEATHVHGVQSEALLDRRIGCLQRRKQEFEGLLAVFAHPDGATVDRSLSVVRGLPELARCADLEALARAVDPPADPDRREHVERVRGDLARARALAASANVEAGMTAATDLLASAEATQYRPVVAEAKLQHAKALAQSGKLRAAEAPAADAVLIAEELGMDRLAAAGHTFLSMLLGTELARYDEGMWHGELALAKLRRTGADGAAEAEVYTWLGAAADQKGDYPLSKRYAQLSMDLWREAAPDAPAYAMAVGNYGRVAFRERDYQAALAHFEQGLEILISLHGPRHPDVGKLMSNIAAVYHATERYEDGREALVESVAILETALGPDHPDLGVTLTNLGNAHLRLKEYEEALTVTRRGLDIKTATLGETHPSVGYSLNNVGLILLKLERREEALQEYRHALTVLEAGLGPEHPGVLEPLLGIGEVLQQLGRSDESVPPLRRALSLATQPEHASDRAAEVQYLLARALWTTGERSQADTLATQARATFVAEDREASVAGLDEWLDSREP